MNRTRAEHIAWCKERAKAEVDFYPNDPKQGIISMMSDIGKHPETNSEALRAMCGFELMRPQTAQSVLKFIDGFN